MTKIALVADVHLANHRRWGGPVVGGLNRRGREAVDVLRRASIFAREQECSALFVLGDLFDTSRPSPPLVAAALGALEAGGVKAYVILGNHDRQSQEDQDHACAPMVYSRNVEVISKNSSRRWGDLQVACVPYQPGEASTWLPGALFEACGQNPGRMKTLALSHLGIWDEDTPPYLKSARDAVGIGQVRWLCDTHKVDAFIAGNWHHYRVWKGPQLVMIPGTLVPHTFSDEARAPLPSSVGCVAIYDSIKDTATPYRIAGPRFITVSLEGIKGIQSPPKDSEWMLYLRLRVKREELGGAMDLGKVIEQDFNAMVEVEAEDGPEVVQRAAAEAIKASEGDLVDAYADLADVQPPGTKEGVQRRLAEYRKGAG